METSNSSYNLENSLNRIDEILELPAGQFEDKKDIPLRSSLTFKNGYYINVTALFVDIRESSSLADSNYRPKLAKLYRSFLSEVVAIVNSNINCKEINIVGDCVSAVYEGHYKEQLNTAFVNAFYINALVNILNYKYKKKSIPEISIGIGISWGRALMIKAGYKGSSLNDVVWMGNVVNEASHLCQLANKSPHLNYQILLSSELHENLNEKNQDLCHSYYDFNMGKSIYRSNAVSTELNNWYKENCL